MHEFTMNLNKQDSTPLYIQLYNYIQQEIVAGHLPKGTRLPSRRHLAMHFKISKTTVETAYQQLLAEGYIESKERSGYYVADCGTEFLDVQPVKAIKAVTQHNDQNHQILYDFRNGGIDVDSFPFQFWTKVMNQCKYEKELLLCNDPQGEYELRCEIEKYLRYARAVLCHPEQIVLGAGSQQSKSLLSLLLKKYDDTIAVEEPGSANTKSVFVNHGFKLQPIPVEEDGLNVEELRRCGARIVYITPSHQFPQGVILTIKKRM